MTDRITGARARRLLDGVGAKPWRVEEESWLGEDDAYSTGRWHVVRGEGDDTVDLLDISPESRGERGEVDMMHLAAAAPSMASTIDWLCGAAPDDPSEGDDAITTWSAPGDVTVAINVEFPLDEMIGMSAPTWSMMSPDDAEEIARALLAAAERARSLQAD